MPYHLYLEEGTDIDTRINNLTNFYYWCATRLLTLDRQYAKESLNSIGASQAATERDRAQIALSYHCLTLTDIHWVKKDRPVPDPQDRRRLVRGPCGGLPDVLYAQAAPGRGRRHL